MQIIWKHVKSFWAEEMINLPHPYIILDYAEEIKKWEGREGCDLDIREDNPQPFYVSPIYTWPTSVETNYSFPPPSDINIKMMPFLAAQTFDQSKLPRYLRPYWDMIWLCLRQEMARNKWEFWPRDKMPSEIGKVYYLTILENEVEPGSSQGRPGLRVESEGIVKVKNEDPIIAFEGAARIRKIRIT